MDYFFLCVLTLFFGYIQCYGPNQYYENHKYCDDLTPYYGDIDLDTISGVWYGVEKIPHASKGEYRVEHTNECFHIEIKETHVQPTPAPFQPLTNYPYVDRAYGIPEHFRIRHFVLEWHEGLWQENYHLRVNTSHKGFWPTDVPDKSVDKIYRPFGGVIQVLKVSHNHLVLNFCMRLPYSQLYSVVLSRNENQLTPEDLSSIHRIFSMKNLSTSALKRVCENSGSNFSISSAILIFISFLLCKCR